MTAQTNANVDENRHLRLPAKTRRLTNMRGLVNNLLESGKIQQSQPSSLVVLLASVVVIVAAEVDEIILKGCHRKMCVWLSRRLSRAPAR